MPQAFLGRLTASYPPLPIFWKIVPKIRLPDWFADKSSLSMRMLPGRKPMLGALLKRSVDVEALARQIH